MSKNENLTAVKQTKHIEEHTAMKNVLSPISEKNMSKKAWIQHPDKQEKSIDAIPKDKETLLTYTNYINGHYSQK